MPTLPAGLSGMTPLWTEECAWSALCFPKLLLLLLPLLVQNTTQLLLSLLTISMLS